MVVRTLMWQQSIALMAQQPEHIEVKRKRYSIRNRVLHDAIMMRDYFTGGKLTYLEENFHDRLRMKRELFLKIKDDLCEMDPEWPQRIDALGIPGHSPHMKTLDCLRLLATGQSTDSIDDYVRMGKTTLYKYLKRFVRNIVRRYGGEYLRNPNQDDINRILAENEARGFPGKNVYWPLVKNMLHKDETGHGVVKGVELRLKGNGDAIRGLTVLLG
ncbi:uncharacterized protein LOC113305208 [Papaver somniferum]|uniref:uncharacterized protein LOC113305208 n=1 Tax=Papaver somniferum TaxID=3469 RepID=UPI000E6F9C26|nr:uncharacterized protein LOC113305208 [Papaver somniferum]